MGRRKGEGWGVGKAKENERERGNNYRKIRKRGNL